MMLLVVPNELRDQIQAAIDKALNGRPIDPQEREEIYGSLLGYFDEHGIIPDFELTTKAGAA